MSTYSRPRRAFSGRAFLNTVFLLALGFLVERRIGSLRMVFVIICSVLLGGIVYVLLEPNRGIIGSGVAIIALLGAYAVILIKVHRRLPIWELIAAILFSVFIMVDLLFRFLTASFSVIAMYLTGLLAGIVILTVSYRRICSDI